MLSDGAGTIVDVTSGAARRLGYEAAELVGRSIFELLHPEEVEDALRSFASTLGVAGPNVPVEARVRDATGGWRTFEVVATNLLHDPDVRAMVFHCRDVCERLGQQRRFRAIFEQSPVAQVLIAPDRVGLIANQAFAGLFGRSREECLFLDLRDLVHPDEHDAYVADRDALLHGVRNDHQALRRFVRADGSVFHARVQARPVLDATGILEYLLGSVEDVSDQIEATRLVEASEARFRALVNNSPDIVAILYPDGNWEASDEGTRQLGYPKGHDPDGGVFSLIHPDDLDSAGRAFSEIMAGTRSSREPLELRLRAADDTYWDFECLGQNLGTDPSVGGIVVTARNVTDRKHAERALREAQTRFQTAFERAPLTVSLIDLDGHILDINPSGCALLGRSRDDLLGSDARATIHPDDLEHALEATTQQLVDGTGRAEFRLRRADGTDVWVLSSAALVTPDTDSTPYVITLQADITARKELEARLAHDASTDPLTGLLNRAAFMTHLEQLLARRAGHPAAVLFLDLDHFKAVNDTAGHDAGDAVLHIIAQRLNDSTRAGDLIARLGGDEFVVLCHDSDSHAAELTAQRIITATSAPIGYDDHVHHVSASVGVAIINEQDTAASAIRRADTAAYQAKRNGGSAVHIADPTSRASQTPPSPPRPTSGPSEK